MFLDESLFRPTSKPVFIKTGGVACSEFACHAQATTRKSPIHPAIQNSPNDTKVH
jgi:hypothetical protein